MKVDGIILKDEVLRSALKVLNLIAGLLSMGYIAIAVWIAVNLLKFIGVI